MRELLRQVTWRNRIIGIEETCALSRDDDGFQFDGLIRGEQRGEPLSIRYVIACSAGWLTRRATIYSSFGADHRGMVLESNGEGHWLRDGTEVPSLFHCLDVDLSLSPSTSTLPIRRFELSVGARGRVTAAMVSLPGLEVEGVWQAYRRLEPNRYHFESRGGAFHAEMEVDDLGLVTRYGEAWERVA